MFSFSVIGPRAKAPNENSKPELELGAYGTIDRSQALPSPFLPPLLERLVGAAPACQSEGGEQSVRPFHFKGMQLSGSPVIYGRHRRDLIL